MLSYLESKKRPLPRDSSGDLRIIVHWGVYSVPAFDSVESAQLRKIQNGSEWYQKRLLSSPEDRPFPTSGWKPTQAYHLKHYGAKVKYEDFKEMLNKILQESKWNPDTWVQLWQKAGVSTVILTAKHHDGFCLWPTKTTDFKSDQDLVGQVQSACHKAGMKFGIYYSWGEFTKSGSDANYLQTVRTQIDELLAYKPSVTWFDGHWFLYGKAGQLTMNECVKKIKKALPECEINDRLGDKQKYQSDETYLGLSTYRVYADRHVPARQPSVPWEHVNTISFSWGYNRMQLKQHYKTGQDLFDLYTKVKGLGGRFLLNFGPRADGTLDPFEVEAFEQFVGLKSQH